MPETRELEIQLDGEGVRDLELLAQQQGITPEQLAARILNKELDRMSRPPPSRSKVRSLGRKG